MKYLPLEVIDATQQVYDESVKEYGPNFQKDEMLFDMLINPYFATNLYQGKFEVLNKGFRNFILTEAKNNISYIAKMMSFHAATIISHEWANNKQVYQPDKDFIDMLMDIDVIDIYDEDLKYFPYQTFYVDLCNFKGVDEDIDGTFIKLIHKERDGKNYLDIYMVGVIWKNNEINFRHPEVFSLCLNDKVLHITKDTFKVTNSNFMSSDIILETEKYKTRKTKYDVLTHNENNIFFIFRFLMFLNIKEPDIQENPVTKQTYKPYTTPKNKFSEIKKWDVGVRYGEKIRLWKETEKHYYNGHNQKSSSPRPHIRKGHFSHVWCGPKGNQYLKLVFIHELFVNGSAKDIIVDMNQIETNFKDRYDGERCIAEWLDANHISYERQKYIPEIRKYFDFYVDNEYMIEFDGEQHFHPVEHFGGEEKFKQQKQYDELKNEWCLDHRIPLIRIRYDEKPLLNQILSKYFKVKEKEETLER